MDRESILRQHYPWIKLPLICCAPMRLIALSHLATEVSKAGGIGFLGSGNDQSSLGDILEDSKRLLEQAALPVVDGVLPIGIGFINWGADLAITLPLLKKYRPAAAWLFAPTKTIDLVSWTEQIRTVTDGVTKIWVQVGSVADAVEVTISCKPDVLVVQGTDAGGHGLNHGCSIISLLPEVHDALREAAESGNINEVPLLVSAGGIMEGRGVAASLALGADGVTMGTRYLVSEEAVISKGYKDAVLRASDGGQSTVRSKVYDNLRGTTQWGENYGGRGVINQSYHDAQNGMSLEENKTLYEASASKGDEGWAPDHGRMTTYAGTGVGLAKKVQPAAEITVEVREDAIKRLAQMKTTLS